MNDRTTDILITRVIDGRASAADWHQFEAVAEREPAAWRDLALAQHDDRALRGAVAEGVARAESRGLPDEASIDEAAGTMSRRTRRVATWAGWAAAAAVALAFVTQRPQTTPGGTPFRANLGTPISTAADVLSDYLEKGRSEGVVIDELPQKMLVETTPDGQGGYNVVYLRLIMERASVPDLYKFSSDELGQQAPVRVVPVSDQPKKPFRPVL